jgi:hypothetical protein
MHPVLQHCQAVLFPLCGRSISHVHKILDMYIFFCGAGKCDQCNDNAAGWTVENLLYFTLLMRRILRWLVRK